MITFEGKRVEISKNWSVKIRGACVVSNNTLVGSSLRLYGHPSHSIRQLTYHFEGEGFLIQLNDIVRLLILDGLFLEGNRNLVSLLVLIGDLDVKSILRLGDNLDLGVLHGTIESTMNHADHFCCKEEHTRGSVEGIEC